MKALNSNRAAHVKKTRAENTLGKPALKSEDGPSPVKPEYEPSPSPAHPVLLGNLNLNKINETVSDLKERQEILSEREHRSRTEAERREAELQKRLKQVMQLLQQESDWREQLPEVQGRSKTGESAKRAFMREAAL